MISATWKAHPGTNDYDTATNWTGNTLPDGTASFAASDTHKLTFSTADTTVGGWTFDQGASHYIFTLSVANAVLDFTGAGIAVKGGTATINIDNSRVDFSDDAKAGTAHFAVADGGVLAFGGTSSAAKAQVTTSGVGGVLFESDSSAGNAHISGGGVFLGDSSAANASLTVTSEIDFGDHSTAGSAAIANDGVLAFKIKGSAGNAVITTTSGHSVIFQDTSDGATSRLIADAGGLVDFSSATGPNHDNVINAGSIEGAGTFDLGANQLVVGSRGLSTKVSGMIEGTGGLDKVGADTLTLSHKQGNTYSGGTVLDAGTFDVAAPGAAGTGPIVFGSGSAAKLTIENAALSSHNFGNEIDFFSSGQSIDLPGLKFAPHAKAILSGDTLTVTSGHLIDTLSLFDPAPGTFKVKNDGHGGSKISLVPDSEKSASANPAASGARHLQFKHGLTGPAHHANELHAGEAAHPGPGECAAIYGCGDSIVDLSYDWSHALLHDADFIL